MLPCFPCDAILRAIVARSMFRACVAVSILILFDLRADTSLLFFTQPLNRSISSKYDPSTASVDTCGGHFE
jgi:hypothetical protein